MHSIVVIAINQTKSEIKCSTSQICMTLGLQVLRVARILFDKTNFSNWFLEVCFDEVV